MEIIFLLVAVIAIGAGLLLILAPQVLIKMSELLNRVFATEDIIFSRRLLFGVIFILAGLYMIYMYLQLP